MTAALTTPERFRGELLESLVAGAAGFEARRGVRPRWRRRRAQRLVSVAVAGAVAVAIVFLLDTGGGVAPQPASAATVLRASAAALERAGQSLALGRGDYLYTRLLLWWRYAGEPRSYVVRSDEEIWTARDGSGRDLSHVLGVGGISRTSPLARGADSVIAPTARPFVLAGGVSSSYAGLQRLPADPRRLSLALGSRAARAAGRYVPLGLASRAQWRAILTFDMLRALAAEPAPIAVRAAVYRVLAGTPGIRLGGAGTDATGRRGALLTATLGAFRYTLLIDPATGRLLETSRILLHASAQAPGLAPGLVNRATFLAVGVVGSLGGRRS